MTGPSGRKALQYADEMWMNDERWGKVVASVAAARAVVQFSVMAWGRVLVQDVLAACWLMLITVSLRERLEPSRASPHESYLLY